MLVSGILVKSSEGIGCWGFRKECVCSHKLLAEKGNGWGWGVRSFKAGCAQRAVEQYSEALESCSSAGPPAFVAVLRANRAAAFQKLKKYTQAIADCLCALALNPNYFKVRPWFGTCVEPP